VSLESRWEGGRQPGLLADNLPPFNAEVKICGAIPALRRMSS
jgi:hypothetical protein